MGHENLHEPAELLSDETKNLHRAIISLIEELEAIDWYQQRAEACTDPALAEVLIHNKNEEIEHAMMTLEWVRRASPMFDQHMRTYLFAAGSILEAEAAATSGEAPAASTPGAGGSLGLGSLKG